MKILICGGGNMGQAFVKGLSKKSRRYEVSVLEKDDLARQKCKQLGANVFQNVSEITKADQFDVAVIAVKPDDVKELSHSVSYLISEKTLIISIAAGVSLTKLESYFRGFSIVRVMPNLGASVGESASAFSANSQSSDEDISIASGILETLGTSNQVNEDQLDLVTAISGSGPAYFFLLAELLENTAIANGLDVQVAKTLVTQTFKASALLGEKESFSQLRERVTSPNGTTQAGLKVFEQAGFQGLVENVVNAAKQRAQELNQ